MPTSKRGIFARMLAFVASIFATTHLPVHAGTAGQLPASRQPFTAEAKKTENNLVKDIADVSEEQAGIGSELGSAKLSALPTADYYLSARLRSVAKLNTPVVNGVRRKARRSGPQDKAMPKRIARKQGAKRTVKVQPSWQRPSANRMARINARPSAVIVNLPIPNRSVSQTAQWSAAA